MSETPRFTPAQLRERARVLLTLEPRLLYEADASMLDYAAGVLEAQHEYQRGRQAVMRELTAAVARFNDDDSIGISQLIDAIAPWLFAGEGQYPQPPAGEPERTP